MIGTRQELFEAIKKTLALATPEAKRQIRDALLEGLGGNRCQVCGEERRTLIHDNQDWKYLLFPLHWNP
jgi:hypothetical protein